MSEPRTSEDARAERALQHLERWIDAEIAAGAKPVDLAAVLNAALASVLYRAGHKNIRNIAPALSEHLVRAHDELARSKAQ